MTRLERAGAWVTLLTCVLVGLPATARGKWVSGVLETTENWHFLTRFCFLSKLGSIHLKVSYPQHYGVESILLYYDDETQWPSVYKNDSKNCKQKRGVLNPDNFQIIDLYEGGAWSGCSLSNSTGVPTHHCDTERQFESSRERWWYVALSNCDATKKGMYLNYTILMSNGDPSDVFFHHFSADEFFLIQTDVTFLLLTTIMFILSFYVAKVLSNRQLYHTTYKMYMVALFIELVHLLFMCCVNGDYAHSGVKCQSAEYMGRMLRSASELTFLLMLILVGKGFTITRGRLNTSSTIKITVFMTVYILLYMAVFLWEAHFFDPGLVLYRYESPPGYCLIGLRLLGWFWLSYAVTFTLKHYPEKSSFYMPFYAFYTLWFMAGPIIVLIAMKVMSPWVREKVVNAVENTVAFLGFVFFLILTRPSAANRNFPYHVRTSQIACMSDEMARENGAAVTYSPDSEHQVNFTDLFVVGKPKPKSINIDRFPHRNVSSFSEHTASRWTGENGF